MITALLLICLGMLMVVTVSGEELTPTASGSCGDNATWEYYESTGELKISGNGDMKDYYASGVAWDYRLNIKKITVAEGITSTEEPIN